MKICAALATILLAGITFPVKSAEEGQKARPDPVMFLVLVQADAAAAPPAPDFILNECQETASMAQFAGTAIRGVDPGYALAIALNEIANKAVVTDLTMIKNITLLEGTKHGEMLTRTASDGRTTFRYNPVLNYVGDDRAVFTAEYAGKLYKIVVNLKVSLGVDYNSPLCPENPYELIKVTKPSSGASGIDTGFSAVGRNNQRALRRM